MNQGGRGLLSTGRKVFVCMVSESQGPRLYVLLRFIQSCVARGRGKCVLYSLQALFS